MPDRWQTKNQKEDKNLNNKIWTSVTVMTTHLNGKTLFIVKAVFGIVIKSTAQSCTIKIYNTQKKNLKGSSTI